MQKITFSSFFIGLGAKPIRSGLNHSSVPDLTCKEPRPMGCLSRIKITPLLVSIHMRFFKIECFLADILVFLRPLLGVEDNKGTLKK